MNIFEDIDKLMMFDVSGGERVRYASVDAKTLSALKGKIADIFIELAEQEGLFAFGGGMYYLLDPTTNKFVNECFKLSPKCQVFLRTAFGDFYYTKKDDIYIMHVSDKSTSQMSDDMASFLKFGVEPNGDYTQDSLFGKSLPGAIAHLGMIAPDECYAQINPRKGNFYGDGHEPDNLRRVKFEDYMKMLTTPPKIDKNAKRPDDFKDLNFKIAICEYLHRMGHYNAEVMAVKRSSRWSSDDMKADPSILNFYKYLEIPPGYLGQVTEFYNEAGDDIYSIICDEWDGEDDQFTIKSIEGIGKLVNLEVFGDGNLIGLHSLDFTPILECGKLRKVHMSDLAKKNKANEQVKKTLEERGVEVS